jgi:A/G-specific adenine glycosylase
MVDPQRTGEWTHALMDVGATLCRPRDPRCAECPLRAVCLSADRWAAEPGTAAAGVVRSRASVRSRAVPFPATRRWLRGRIVGQLRDVLPGRWLTVDGPIGVHSREEVRDALGQLAVDGLIERDRRGRVRLPLTRSPRYARTARSVTSGHPA